MHPALRSSALLLLCLLPLIAGCYPEQRSSITGKITVAVDREVAPAVEAGLLRFQDLYKDAHIEIAQTTSREALIMLAEKKAQLAFVGRDLLKDERDALSTDPNTPVETFPVAIQAIGLVVNSRNLLRAISMEEIGRILKGGERRWDPLGPKLGAIRVVLGRPNSTTYLALRQLKLFDSLRCVYQFVDTPGAVDSICAAQPNALGFQPLLFLPRNDKGAVRNLDIFTVLKEDTSKIPVAISSHPANIVREYYPLRSKVFAVRRDDGVNLATGVVSFFTSAVGQKLLLDKGLVPATMPVRLIQFGQSVGE